MDTPYIERCLGVPRQARVFPVKPNSKLPAIPQWQKRATNNCKVLQSWFEGRFKGFNIGVATGQGVIVLDVDAKHGRAGFESLDLLDMMGLPKGFRVKTPSGGIHVYLLCDEDIPNSVNSLDGFPGIDVRGTNGYVLGPGSSINGVAYVPLA